MKKGDIRANHRNPFVKFLCFALIFLLNINVFAVTTGDNDGSAFITKAEFDSLKNNFQAQIDTYNQSLDNKIDNAIAAYLSGISLSKEIILNDNISFITFPCEIIDRNVDIKGVHRPADAADGTVPRGIASVWTPAYMVYECYFRGTNLYAQRIKRKYVDKIKDWFWGDVTSGNFKVKGTARDIRVDANLFFYAEGYSRNDTAATGDPETGIIYFDQKVMNNNWGAGSKTNFTRTTSLYADYELLKKSCDDWQYVTDWIFATKTWNDAVGNFTIGNKANGYDYIGFNSNYLWGSQNHTIDEYKDGNVMSHSQSSIDTINMIYNNSTANADSDFAPVAYTATDASGNKIPYIYYTNKKWCRIYDNAYASWPKAQWDYRTKQANVNGGICGMVTLGENIETEYENTTRAWSNKSAIKQSRLVYDFKGNGITFSNHKMTQGIPILVVPDNIESTENCVITLDVDLGSNTTNKYIAVSTKPIDVQGSVSVVEADNTMIINKINGIDVNSYAANLSQGENKIEVGEVSKGEVIYIKVLWVGTDTDTNVTINKLPTFKIKTKS